MCYFIYKHAAQTWAYQQRRWYNRESKIIELAKPTKEGARWAVEIEG
jgi:hypothetical protein